MPGHQDIQSALEALPGAALLAMGALIVVGLVMWLAGALLVRVACVISGLVIGGTLGWLVGLYFKDEGAYVLPLAIGGAILGGLMAGLLFRLWIAAAGALLFALVVPAVSLVWQGAVPVVKHGPGHGQKTDQPAESSANQPRSDKQSAHSPEQVIPQFNAKQFLPRDQDMTSPATGEQGNPPSKSETEKDNAGLAQLWHKVTNLLLALKSQLADQARAWWASLDGPGRQIVYLGLLIGAAIGLVLGLFAPWLSAALQSSLIGSCMIYVGTAGLLRRTAGQGLAIFPDTARGVILLIGLITALGALLQWLAYRKQTDK